MDEYRIAKVRFSADGKAYPVNCAFRVQPGDFVIVRMNDQFTRLRKAEVVETGIWRGACKYTVMCRAEDAEAYGTGSDGVQDQGTLDRFLTEGMGFGKYPVKASMGRWHTAYISFYTPPFHPGSVHAGYIIALGDEGVGMTGPGYPNSDGHHLPLAEGVITRLPSLFPQKGPDIYAKAARFAESKLFQPI